MIYPLVVWDIDTRRIVVTNQGSPGLDVRIILVAGEQEEILDNDKLVDTLRFMIPDEQKRDQVLEGIYSICRALRSIAGTHRERTMRQRVARRELFAR